MSLEHTWHPLAILLTSSPDSAIAFTIILSTISVFLTTSVLLLGSWRTSSFSQALVWFSFASFSSCLIRWVLLMQEGWQLILFLSCCPGKVVKCDVNNRFFFFLCLGILLVRTVGHALSFEIRN